MSRRLQPTAVCVVALLTALPARADELGRILVEGAGQALGNTLFNIITSPPRGDAILPIDFEELHDWADPATGTSARLSAGCDGVALVTLLTGTPSENYLNLLVARENDAIEPRLRSVTVRFGAGQPIQLGVVSASVAIHGVRPMYALFPRKSDFADVRSIDVEVALEQSKKTCALRVHYERLLAQRPSTYVEYAPYDLWIGAGPRFASSGGLESDRSQWDIELGMAIFPSVHHGITIDFVIDQDFGNKSSPDVHGLGLLFGHVVRIFLGRQFTLSYSTAFGAMFYELEDQDDVRLDETNAFAIRQRLRLEARFHGFLVAPSLVYLHVLDGRLAGSPLRGSGAALVGAVGGSW
jgi:hypothetical protein